MATGYVTNWGNDENDGLTWETAKKTFQGAKDVGLSPVYAKGWFDERIPDNVYIYAEKLGDLIIDGRNFNYSRTPFYTRTNIIFSNYKDLMALYPMVNCHINNCEFNYNNTGYHNPMSKCILNNCNVSSESIKICPENSTLFNFKKEFSLTLEQTYNIIPGSNNIIYNPDGVRFLDLINPIKYSLFIHTKFKFTGGGLGTDETSYSYPTGNTDDEKLQNLRDRMVAVYGGQASDYLVGCKYYSRDTVDETVPGNPAETAYQDIFVDADNGNFYLKPDSIAAHMAYDGSYIGAKPVGAQAVTVPNGGSWTLQNINNTDGLITQEGGDDALANYLDVFDLGNIKEIVELQAIAEIAYRNGMQINTQNNLSTPISAGTNVLTAGKTYMVINAPITLDNAAATVYNPWETFNAIDEGSGAGLGFDDGGASPPGQVQEVLIDQYDEKIKLKAHKEDSSLNNANIITLYLHEKPMVNLDASGNPQYGNADTDFDPATAQPLYARYIGKFDITIKNENLPAR